MGSGIENSVIPGCGHGAETLGLATRSISILFFLSILSVSSRSRSDRIYRIDRINSECSTIEVLRRFKNRLHRDEPDLEAAASTGFAPNADGSSEGNRDAMDHGQA